MRCFSAAPPPLNSNEQQPHRHRSGTASRSTTAAGVSPLVELGEQVHEVFRGSRREDPAAEGPCPWRRSTGWRGPGSVGTGSFPGAGGAAASRPVRARKVPTTYSRRSGLTKPSSGTAEEEHLAVGRRGDTGRQVRAGVAQHGGPSGGGREHIGSAHREPALRAVIELEPVAEESQSPGCPSTSSEDEPLPTAARRIRQGTPDRPHPPGRAGRPHCCRTRAGAPRPGRRSAARPARPGREPRRPCLPGR